MDLITKLTNDKNMYQKLKDQVQLVIRNLENVILNLEGPSKNIGSAYSINGESADKGTLKKVFDSVETKKNYLKNKILPDLDNKMAAASKGIEEEYERIAAEEAKRKADAEEEARRLAAAAEEARRLAAAAEEARRKAEEGEKEKQLRQQANATNRSTSSGNSGRGNISPRNRALMQGDDEQWK